MIPVPQLLGPPLVKPTMRLHAANKKAEHYTVDSAGTSSLVGTQPVPRSIQAPTTDNTTEREQIRCSTCEARGLVRKVARGPFMWNLHKGPQTRTFSLRGTAALTRAYYTRGQTRSLNGAPPDKADRWTSRWSTAHPASRCWLERPARSARCAKPALSMPSSQPMPSACPSTRAGLH